MEGKGLSYFYITVAAILWGMAGLFSKTLTGMGFSSIEMNFARSLVAAVIVGVLFWFTDKNVFKLSSIKDFFGLAAIAVFGYCTYGVAYFMAINETSVGVAGALFYTYPSFVLLLSWIFLKEKITIKKILIILITFLGCLLVSGALETGAQSISLKGIFMGILAGLAFAIYNILGKKYLGIYSSQTIIFYMFVISMVVFALIINPVAAISKISAAKVWPIMAAFAITISVIPYLVHLKGLKKVDASTASILSTAEPISAMVLGITVFGETATAIKMAGIILIVGAVIFMSIKTGDTWGVK